MKLAFACLAGAGAALGACAEYYPPPPPYSAEPAYGAAPSYESAPAYVAAPGHGAEAAARVGGCFRTQEIRNHTIGDSRTLYIGVTGGDVYKVGMSSTCLAGAASSDPVVVRPPPGSASICRPLDLNISISRGGFETRCMPESLARLTPEEVAALPPGLRP